MTLHTTMQSMAAVLNVEHAQGRSIQMSRVNSDDIITNIKSCDTRIKNGSATTNVTNTGETSTEDNFTGNELYQQTYDKLQNRYDDVGYQYQSDKEKLLRRK